MKQPGEKRYDMVQKTYLKYSIRFPKLPKGNEFSESKNTKHQLELY